MAKIDRLFPLKAPRDPREQRKEAARKGPGPGAIRQESESEDPCSQFPARTKLWAANLTPASPCQPNGNDRTDSPKTPYDDRMV